MFFPLNFLYLLIFLFQETSKDDENNIRDDHMKDLTVKDLNYLQKLKRAPSGFITFQMLEESKKNSANEKKKNKKKIKNNGRWILKFSFLCSFANCN